MITKLATFRGVSETGEPLVHLFKPGMMEKAAGEIHPEIQAWLSNYKPDDNELVLLVNALGASDYWGQNSNGDYTSWEALSHACSPECAAKHPFDDLTKKRIPPYGYKTYLKAHPFIHHRNKDPNRAFGRVVVSVLNHRMKRVEIVVIIDKARAKEFGAGHIVDRIEAGEYPDVSMGMRVPWDECRICGHRSRTKEDYCRHIRDSAGNIKFNTILPDGRQIGVKNLYPRFFDISFVFIGADKTAKVMCKLASGLWVPLSVAEGYELYGEAEEGLVKAACGNGSCSECSCGCTAVEELEKTSGVLSDTSWGSRQEVFRKELEKQLNKELGGKVDPVEAKRHPIIGRLLGSSVTSKLTKGGKPILEEGGFSFEEIGASVKKAPFLKKWDVVGDALYLKPEYRRKGIGSSAMRAIKQTAKNIGASNIDIMAEEEGKAAWAKIPGVDFGGSIKDEVHPAYEEWRGKHGGPEVKKGAKPSEYPSEFLMNFEPSHELGMISYRIPVEGAPKAKLDAVPIGIAVGALGLGLAALGAKRLLKTASVDEVCEMSKFLSKEAGGIPTFYAGTAAAQAISHKDKLLRNLFSNYMRTKRIEDLVKESGFKEDIEPKVKEWADRLRAAAKADREKTAAVISEHLTKTYKISGTPEVVHRLEKFLTAAEYLGGVGASRDVSTFIDGDGPDRPKVEGVSESDKKKYLQDINTEKDLIKVSQVKKGAFLSDKDLGIKVAGPGVKMGPPPKRNRKEYPYVGTIHYQGLKIYVENAAGDVREGTGSGGKKWRTKMAHPYGEILGTKGTDKDRLDVYVGSNPEAENVYIVHQNHPGNHPKAGKYDEDKAMIGFDSPEAAKEAYLKHYDRKDFFRSMTTMAFPLFKKMIMGEVKGEKVASLDKVAADMRLEDLFTRKDAQTRERIWKDLDGNKVIAEGSGMDKVAGALMDGVLDLMKNKVAASKKLAEISKRIDPDGISGQVASKLSDGEEDLPKDVLDDMGSKDLSKVLSTTSSMGIVLKPKEFQRIVLIKMGRKDIADDTWDSGTVFGPTRGISQPCPSLSSDLFSTGILRKLLPFLSGRSYMEPVVKRRIIRITIVPKKDVMEKVSNSPLLTKIGAAYNWYRSEMVKVAAESMFDMDRRLLPEAYGVAEEDIFSMKTASVTEKMSPKGIAVSLGTIPLMLMISSHLRSEEEAGEHLGTLEKFVAHHPYLVTLGATAGMRELMKSDVGKRGLDALIRKAKATGQGISEGLRA